MTPYQSEAQVHSYSTDLGKLHSFDLYASKHCRRHYTTIKAFHNKCKGILYNNYSVIPYFTTTTYLNIVPHQQLPQC